MGTMLFYVIAGVVFLFALAVRQKLKSTYSRWSRVRSVTGEPGGRVARTILDANHLQSVPVEPVRGTLTDPYDPRGKRLLLARDNFVGNSAAATAAYQYLVSALQLGASPETTEEIQQSFATIESRQRSHVGRVTSAVNPIPSPWGFANPV